MVRYAVNREINNWLITTKIHEANLKLMGHVTSPIPGKDSSITWGLGQGTITLRRTHNVRLYACTQVPWCVRRYKVPSIDEHLHFDAEFVILYYAEGLPPRCCIGVSGGRRWHNFLNLLHQICTAYVYLRHLSYTFCHPVARLTRLKSLSRLLFCALLSSMPVRRHWSPDRKGMHNSATPSNQGSSGYPIGKSP